MTFKWIGAIFIILGCGGFGFCLATGKRREEKILQQLIQVLNFLECELQYHLTPLPELCRQAGKETAGTVKNIFFRLADELDSQEFPDAASCMNAALFFVMDIPFNIRELFYQLGQTLGRFDLPGQLNGIDSVRYICKQQLEALAQNRDVRLRSYQTLGICAGAALVILLI